MQCAGGGRGAGGRGGRGAPVKLAAGGRRLPHFAVGFGRREGDVALGTVRTREVRANDSVGWRPNGRGSETKNEERRATNERTKTKHEDEVGVDDRTLNQERFIAREEVLRASPEDLGLVNPPVTRAVEELLADGGVDAEALVAAFLPVGDRHQRRSRAVLRTVESGRVALNHV